MDYLNEIKKLPSNIKDILISFFGAQVNREIIEEHNLSEEQAGAFIDLVNDIYLKTIKIENLEVEVSNRLGIDPKRANRLTIDILGKKLLLADDYFASKVSENLQKLGANLAGFAPVVAEELNEIEEERAKLEAEIKTEEDDFQDVLSDNEEDGEFRKQSQEDTLDLFKNDFDKILALGPEFNDLISDYNEDLLEFLQDEDFARDLENILYNNNNVITRIKPIIDNTTKLATVANWLKDFINFHASDNFNAVTLAEYLVNSPSAKRLSSIDKKKIKRLLNIYRNIVFFSENRNNRTNDLEIIPLELVKADNIKKEVVNKEFIEKENEREGVDKDLVMDKEEHQSKQVFNVEDKKQNSLSKEVPETSSLANELEKMLQDYTEGSLEYKTILQEIKRLKSSK